MNAGITRDALVEKMARAIADSFGWKWNWMPSFKDHFARGCSHEECRAAARAALAAIRDAVGDCGLAAEFVENEANEQRVAELTNNARLCERTAALLRAIAEGDADER